MSVATRPAGQPSPLTADRNAPGPEPDGPEADTRFVARVAEALAAWARRRGPGPDDCVDELAAIVAETREPGAVESALVRLAHRAAGPGARRVELIRDAGRGARRVAAWPSGAPEPGRCPAPALEVPLRSGGRNRGTLRVWTEAQRPPSPDRRRRLATLAALAAAAARARDDIPAVDDDQADADDGHPSETSPARVGPTHDAASGLLSAGFFEAYLGYSLALARRRNEPVTLLAIGVDRLDAIRDLHGPTLAEEAIRRVGRTVGANLRASDLIARLDDGRIVAVLQNTPADGALTVADAIRQAVAAAGAPTADMPVLTSSIGVAAFPDHADDAGALRAAAAAALASARAEGRDRVTLAAPLARLRVAQIAG